MSLQQLDALRNLWRTSAFRSLYFHDFSSSFVLEPSADQPHRQFAIPPIAN